MPCHDRPAPPLTLALALSDRPMTLLHPLLLDLLPLKKKYHDRPPFSTLCHHQIGDIRLSMSLCLCLSLPLCVSVRSTQGYHSISLDRSTRRHSPVRDFSCFISNAQTPASPLHNRSTSVRISHCRYVSFYLPFTIRNNRNEI